MNHPSKSPRSARRIHRRSSWLSFQRLHLAFLWLREQLEPRLHKILIALAVLSWLLILLAPRLRPVYHLLRELLSWLSERTEFVVIILGLATALGALYRFLVRMLGHQLQPNLSAFLALPDFDADRRATWKPRFIVRKARPEGKTARSPDPEDIEIFVSLSADEAPIAEANPEVTEKERRELYESWWQINRSTFLILALQEDDAPEEVIAVSIVLPLTPEGAEALISGRKSATKLGVGDIAPERRRPLNLLVDTWIVSRFHRHYHDRYRHALLLKHLSIFWRTHTHGVSIFAEPDTLNMARHLANLGFQRLQRQGKPDLYQLRIGNPALPSSMKEALTVIERRILETLSWPITK